MTVQSQTDIFYSALSRRDSAFEGIFVVGVKTTGVFCRPTCSARMPKRENVEFFSSAREALAHGYRPCKICTPMKYQGTPPDWIKPLLNELTVAPTLKLRDRDLKERGLEPSRVRYWFKKQYGITFQGYLRSMRISQAFGRIKQGGKVADTAFASGYQSLSGFTDSFKKTADFSPSQSPENQLVQTMRIITPLGPMLAGATVDGICLLEFTDRRMLDTEIKRLSKLLNGRFVPGVSKYLEMLNQQLDEYFSGSRKEFGMPLVLPGTTFQKKVWAELQSIPYGTTRSYKEQAEILGSPKAVRAVVKANGDNSIAILVPCHRVVGALTVFLPLVSDHIAAGSSEVFGALLGAMALGEVTSAWLAGSIVLNMSPGKRIALAQILSGLSLTLLLMGSVLWAVAIGLFLLGFFSAPLTIWAQTLRMQVIPPEMRGRTFALLRTLMQGATPLGGALAGFLLPVLGIQVMIGLSSLIIGAPGLAGMQVTALKQAGSE